VNVSGIGAVFARGRGVGRLEEALREGWVAPSRRALPATPDGTIPVYAVDDETIADRAILRRMRRADRFTRMAVLAAWDAVKDSGIEIDGEGASLGIILATAFGPQVTAFRFLDDIIDHGDASVSPTLFSHSVHNAAASYVATALENHGPTLTVTQFGSSFHQALILARAWLHEGRCENVLVGCAEECGTVMEFICSEKLEIAEDGKIRPFEFSSSPRTVPGEGSVFLLLSREGGPRKYCELRGVFVGEEALKGEPDLRILDADGMSSDETGYRGIAGRSALIGSYSPLFGSMLTGSAFHCAVAAMMLMNQTLYACPVQDDPHGLRPCASTEGRSLETIQCVRYDCFGRRAVIELGR
jgi:3-oxoacyl-[acyl-carrier-protein] synthase II